MAINHPQSNSVSVRGRRILFLVTDVPHQSGNDNHEVLPRVFEHLGWNVEIAAHDAVGKISHPEQFDLLWPIGFGPRQSYAARLQQLAQLPIKQFINAPLAVHRLHSKIEWLEHCPATHVSDDPVALTKMWLAEPPTSTWVLKPEAGSYGKAIILLSEASSEDAIHHAMQAQHGSWLLQRYLPEIAKGETRTLICGGEVIGSYLRVPSEGFKANLSQGATTLALEPDDAYTTEPQILDPIRKKLVAEGINFAAVDICNDYLIEVNVANPGGLNTINKLHSYEVIDPKSATVRAVKAILQAKNLD